MVNKGNSDQKMKKREVAEEYLLQWARLNSVEIELNTEDRQRVSFEGKTVQTVDILDLLAELSDDSWIVLAWTSLGTSIPTSRKSSRFGRGMRLEKSNYLRRFDPVIEIRKLQEDPKDSQYAQSRLEEFRTWTSSFLSIRRWG